MPSAFYRPTSSSSLVTESEEGRAGHRGQLLGDRGCRNGAGKDQHQQPVCHGPHLDRGTAVVQIRAEPPRSPGPLRRCHQHREGGVRDGRVPQFVAGVEHREVQPRMGKGIGHVRTMFDARHEKGDPTVADASPSR